MAPIYIVSALFMLALGTTPCLSKLCTLDNMMKCFHYNNDDCPFYRREVKCLEEIDTSTCSNKLLNQYDGQHARAYEWGTACPGLPDGVCYYNIMRACEDGIPYWLVFFSNGLKEDKIKKMCKEFKGKEDKTRACFTALKPKCKRDAILEDIDTQLKYMDDVNKICAGYV